MFGELIAKLGVQNSAHGLHPSKDFKIFERGPAQHCALPRLVPAPLGDPEDRSSPSLRRIQMVLAQRWRSIPDGKPETIDPRLALRQLSLDSPQAAAIDQRPSARRADGM
jgi:hypothetical protein